MIRILSIEQALSLRGIIPELAIIRSLQFQGTGYSPEEHGYIIVIQKDDDFSELTEIDSMTVLIAANTSRLSLRTIILSTRLCSRSTTQ